MSIEDVLEELESHDDEITKIAAYKLRAAQKIVDLVSTFNHEWNSIGLGAYRRRDLEELCTLVNNYRSPYIGGSHDNKDNG